MCKMWEKNFDNGFRQGSKHMSNNKAFCCMRVSSGDKVFKTIEPRSAITKCQSLKLHNL